MAYGTRLVRESRPTELPGDRYHIGFLCLNPSVTGVASREVTFPRVGLKTSIQVVEWNVGHEDAKHLSKVESGKASRSS